MKALLSSCLALLLISSAPAQQGSWRIASRGLDCGYRDRAEWLSEFRAAIERGEIPDPRTRQRPPVRNATHPAPVASSVVDNDDIFPFEDSAGILLTNFSTGQLITLMVDAANALMTTHGDIFDFVGYWVNFVPDHQIGAAFYFGLENDVAGIGLGSFNDRGTYGVNGDQIEGMVMMWNINSSSWQPGTGSNASFTRLALGQEFEHRWALFLPDLLDGRAMQGDNGSCGRVAHWNWRADGQGSSMEISDWVRGRPRPGGGSLPWVATGAARLKANFVSFNTDIPGSVFSYSDLYLMGYVSPAEMDAGNSELRYMDLSDCSSSYFGPISTFSSADVIAAAGARSPDSSTSQKNFRTGWIMIHQPGDAPDAGELGKAASILTQHEADWSTSTLGLGVMDNTLP